MVLYVIKDCTYLGSSTLAPCYVPGQWTGGSIMDASLWRVPFNYWN